MYKCPWLIAQVKHCTHEETWSTAEVFLSSSLVWASFQNDLQDHWCSLQQQLMVFLHGCCLFSPGFPWRTLVVHASLTLGLIVSVIGCPCMQSCSVIDSWTVQNVINTVWLINGKFGKKKSVLYMLLSRVEVSVLMQITRATMYSCKK